MGGSNIHSDCRIREIYYLLQLVFVVSYFLFSCDQLTLQLLICFLER